jgi:endoglucanase
MRPIVRGSDPGSARIIDRRRIAQGVLASLAAPLWPVPLSGAPGNGPAFQRGVAIHHMMNWAAVERSDPRRYSFPPFVGASYETSDRLLQMVAAAGFDFIRLTLDPGPFLQFTESRRDALDRHLVKVLERLLAHGFNVIVDFHPNEHVPDYAPERLVASIDDPLFHGYARMVRRTARLLASLRTQRLALEPMNEPQYGWDPRTTERWQRMLERLHREARAEAPDLLIVLTGAHGGDATGLMAVDPSQFAGSNALFSFHYYELHDFTFQGVKSTLPTAWHRQYLSGLPYPAGSGDPRQVWARVRDNILADNSLNASDKARVLRQAQERVAEYLASGFSRNDISKEFDAVLDWANRHGIAARSILVGEFGVTRTYGFYRASDPAAQEAWMRDVRVEAERRGFGWALWALSGYGGMALVETDDAEALDPVSLRALGMKSGY